MTNRKQNGNTNSEKGEILISKTSIPEIDHELIDKRIELKILPQIIGDRGAIPIEVLNTCYRCDYLEAMDIDVKRYLQTKKIPKLKCPNCDINCHQEFITYLNCHKIQAIQPITDAKLPENESDPKKIEQFRTRKPIVAYYLTDKKEEIPYGVLSGKGLLTVNPKKTPFSYFLIIDDISPEKDYFLNYKISKKDKQDFKKYFTDNKNLDEDINDTIAPQIIGRALAKFFISLVQCSVLYIRPDELGLLSTLFTGDSRCGKSVLILDAIYHLSPIGCEYATAETATRTGISYTIKQVDDQWEIEWGILPLCDKMLVGLDGLHAWGEEESMQLREVISQGRIRVRRVVKADNQARVRRLGSLNYNRKTITYPTRWHATWDSKILGHVDRNRWDTIIVFGENDVKKEVINKRHNQWKKGEIQRKIPADIWRKHIIWIWQLTPEQIIIQDKTLDAIETYVNELHQEFQQSKVKPFTNEFFNIYEKMTVAYAALHHSVDEKDNLVVKPEHAKAIKKKIKEYMGHLELEKVKITEPTTPPDQLAVILSEVRNTNREKIILFIANNPDCRQVDIRNNLAMDRGNMSTYINWFQENQLITSRTKIRLSETGAEVYRKLLEELTREKEELNKQKDGKVVTTNLTTQSKKKNPPPKSIENWDDKNNSDDSAKKEQKADKNNNQIQEKTKKSDTSVVEKVVTTHDDLLPKIEKVMQKKPKYDWTINEICYELGFKSLSKRKEVSELLRNVAMNPKNNTRIRMVDEEGFHWHLVDN